MEILHPGVGEVPGRHYLRATADTVLWGRLPCGADAPVLTIADGDTVTIDTVSHEGILDDQGSDPVAWFGERGVAATDVLADAVAIAAGVPRDAASDGPHVITGPIRVEGARPGDLLRITVERLQPRVPYGVISNRHGKGALPGELPRAPGTVSVFAPVQERDGRLFGVLPAVEGGEPAVTFPLAPFLGTMGVAVAGGERPHSVPPGPHGGNIDINLLREGSELYLPVQVEGALAYVGDPHFAQGDGEVALTALEASLRATLRFDVVPREEAVAQFGDVSGPLARTAEYLVPTGMDRDLGEAMRRCVRAALTLIQARWGLEEHLAYAYLSAATDFDISQVVDIVCGVHARIREADFAAPPTAPVAPAEAHRAPAFDRAVWRSVGDPFLPGAADGPLRGLAVAVKDLFAVAGSAIGAGVPAYLAEARPEPATAPAVADLLRAGASLRGIARTDEFAYSIAGANPHYGTPPNPAVPGALPGGSSSGPATAVAAGQAEIGLGTDTAGSIRVPASYQGLWGLRSTHDLVPRQGLLPLAQSFDAVGWITRDGETLQRVVEWCLSYDSSETTENVFGASDADLPWRFVVPEPVLSEVEPATRAAFEAFAAALVSGPDAAQVIRDASFDADGAVAAFRAVQAAEAWRTHGEWLDAHPGALGAAVAERFRHASTVTPAQEASARAVLTQCRADLTALTARGVLLLPTAPGPAPRVSTPPRELDGVRAATIRMTALAAVGGLPALSVPLLRVGAAPVGVSLVAPAGTDIALVRLARRVAAAVAR